MIKISPFALVLILMSGNLHSQTPEIKGKPIAEVFTDFHINLNDTSKTTGFGLTRAYIGYNYLPGNNFSATIILNAGNPDDLPPDAVHRRYAYLREASVTYANERLRISFGITSTKHFDYEQRFWGKRYVANTFQALNGYGYVADLGVVADYKFSDIISGDVTVMNGKGYSELQLDNGVKTSAGLTVTPNQQLVFRLYNDIERESGIWQYTLLTFAGFKNDLLTIGAELNYKTNLDLQDGHNGWGISTTGALNITGKYQIFARYDYAASVNATDYHYHWNYLSDGNLLIGGLQYTCNQNFKVSLNYQENIPYDAGLQSTGLISLDASFKF